MEISSIASRFGKFFSDNSPTILTAAAVTGTITTAILAGRASFKAVELIREDAEQFDLEERISEMPRYINKTDELRDQFLLTWRLYIPAVATGAATIACMVAANQIGTRRAAAMAAAYSLADKAFDEYREKVVEKLGEKKEQAARTEIAQQRVTQQPPAGHLEDAVLIGDTMSVLCCDLFTGRYFLSDMETMRRAMNDINYQVNNDYYASLTDFYNLIGLDPTSMSDDFGWNADKLLDLDFNTVLTPSGKPCLTINFRVVPTRGYHRLQ
jgi:hypothetical protein